jgi:prolyl-tRNA synthetase
MPKNAISPTRHEDYPEWYQQVVRAGELAEASPVRGCMVIKPHGFALWERMQGILDGMFKATGHRNAYFPLFIPLSYLEQEAKHVEGFAKECAVVTHHRLELGPDGRLIPTGKLEEPLVVRPTSETIIGAMYAKWIQSWRDLPVLINQWANVVRWEMRTRLFLRTMEFLWQEGHTAHATLDEAEEETRRMLGVYRTFMEDWMAMPVITGLKTDSERFAGALRTYACEGLMRDNKALQAGTSHNLGQNFARAFDVRYQTEEGEHVHVWSTSWGVSTRLIGALIMTHGDDEGLVLPPRLAPYEAVIVPIWRSDDQRAEVLVASERVRADLTAAGVRVHLDAREGMNPGSKYYDWERRGVPLRLEIGPRDVAAESVMTVRRFTPPDLERKAAMSMNGIGPRLRDLLIEFQDQLLSAARDRREAATVRGVEDYSDFRDLIENDGGFVFTGWCGEESCEQKVKEDTKATIRVIPDEEFRSSSVPVRCLCGAPSIHEVVRARAY